MRTKIMRQKNLLGQIKKYVELGKVDEEFKSTDFDFLVKSKSFLSKHAVGNGKYNEFFIRVEKGKYKLK